MIVPRFQRRRAVFHLACLPFLVGALVAADVKPPINDGAKPPLAGSGKAPADGGKATPPATPPKTPPAPPSAAALAFQRAMASQSSDDKRRAIAALASGGDDGEALPLLISALGDRQANTAAIDALRARTGLTPPKNRAAASGYPGYPGSDGAGDWQAWLTARTSEKDKDAKLKELQQLAEEAKTKAEEAKAEAEGKGKKPEAGAVEPKLGPDGKPLPEVADGDAVIAKPVLPPRSDLGGLDRITFRTGGSLVCYLMSKRFDIDGKLVSVRVIHTDEGGEETLNADLIARIDEDVQ